MDTRSKILTAAGAAERLRQSHQPVVAVSGYFDVLLAEDVRQLRSVADRTAGCTLVALLIAPPEPVLSVRARAEIAAALAMIDYVVIADGVDPEALAAAFGARELVRLEAGQQGRLSELIEHVHRRNAANT